MGQHESTDLLQASSGNATCFRDRNRTFRILPFLLVSFDFDPFSFFSLYYSRCQRVAQKPSPLLLCLGSARNTMSRTSTPSSSRRSSASTHAASPTSSSNRRASASTDAGKPAQRPHPLKRDSSDLYATDRSTSENRWINEQSLRRAQNPPTGAQGIVIKVPCDDPRLDGKQLHGYITNGTFKGRMPNVRIKHRSHFQGVLQRSASGNHDIVLDGYARKALCFPDSLGGKVGQCCAFLAEHSYMFRY